MDNELALKLYNRTLEIKRIGLNELQSDKFKLACEKTIIENPGLSFQDLVIASKVYLGLILDFPELDLGPVVKPL